MPTAIALFYAGIASFHPRIPGWYHSYGPEHFEVGKSGKKIVTIDSVNPLWRVAGAP